MFSPSLTHPAPPQVERHPLAAPEAVNTVLFERHSYRRCNRYGNPRWAAGARGRGKGDGVRSEGGHGGKRHGQGLEAQPRPPLPFIPASSCVPTCLRWLLVQAVAGRSACRVMNPVYGCLVCRDKCSRDCYCLSCAGTATACPMQGLLLPVLCRDCYCLPCAGTAAASCAGTATACPVQGLLPPVLCSDCYCLSCAGTATAGEWCGL